MTPKIAGQNSPLYLPMFFSSLSISERSRKLHKTRISALFVLVTFFVSSHFQRGILNFFSKFPKNYCHFSWIVRHSLHVDIPLLLRFTSAKRHDSVSFLVAFHEFEKHMPDLHISNMCLDSAMDNYPTYKRTLSPIAFVSCLIVEGCLPCLFFTAALLNMISSARKPLYYWFAGILSELYQLFIEFPRLLCE